MSRRALDDVRSRREDDAPLEHEMPVIGPGGRLMYRNRTTFLTERDALIVSVFLYDFGSELADLSLLDRVWPEGATRRTLRLCLRRLNRRLARVGLTIVQVGNHADAMHPMEAIERSVA